MRLLHAGHADRLARYRAAPSGRRRAAHSRSSCPATSAAAPAISASSRRCAASRRARRGRRSQRQPQRRPRRPRRCVPSCRSRSRQRRRLGVRSPLVPARPRTRKAGRASRRASSSANRRSRSGASSPTFRSSPSCLPGAVLTEHDAQQRQGHDDREARPDHRRVQRLGGDRARRRGDARHHPRCRHRPRHRFAHARRCALPACRRRWRRDDACSSPSSTHSQGTLAQFSRTSLAQDLGRRLVAEFAERLNSRLAGTRTAASAPTSAPLDAGSLLWQWLRERLRRLLGG